MVLRAQYATALKCDRCGTTGSASFAENDDESNQGGFSRELLTIEGKFRAEVGSGAIYCVRCGEKVCR